MDAPDVPARVTGPRTATLTFERRVEVRAATLYHVWIAPAARAVWGPPAPDVTVDILEADARVGGREVSVCKVAGQPDVRVEAGWLEMSPPRRTVGYEVVSVADRPQSAALVTAHIGPDGADDQASTLCVTVQLSSLGDDMEAGYRQGFAAGLANLHAVSARTMVLEREIAAPVAVVWGAWMNAERLPQWWGPEGFTCRTTRIDLRAGGEWVFEMIGPDGTVYPNHHRYGAILPQARLDYTLHWGENGPKHADAWASFADHGGTTTVTLGMVFATAEEHAQARGFGAEALGLQTLGKLARAVGAA
jgi:uncharacterized protein YndB with AHSA1/START domain